MPTVAVVFMMATSALVGCSDSKFTFADVEGQILLDGVPVDKAKVVFIPTTTNETGESGPYSVGLTDANGRYRLHTQDEAARSGAVVGQHRVIVTTKQARLDPNVMDREIIDVPESIPLKYTHYKKTPLAFEVPPGGAENADFALVTSEGS